MIIKWFQTWLRGRAPVVRAPLLRAPVRKRPESSLWDVAHEVLSKEQTIKTKVKKFLSLPLSEAESDDLVDEVTEKISDAAEADPRIHRLFEDS